MLTWNSDCRLTYTQIRTRFSERRTNVILWRRIMFVQVPGRDLHTSKVVNKAVHVLRRTGAWRDYRISLCTSDWNLCKVTKDFPFGFLVRLCWSWTGAVTPPQGAPPRPAALLFCRASKSIMNITRIKLDPFPSAVRVAGWNQWISRVFVQFENNKSAPPGGWVTDGSCKITTKDAHSPP